MFPFSDSLHNHEEQLWPPEDNTQGPIQYQDTILPVENILLWR